MKIFISNFFLTDIKIRAAVLLALLIVLFWWVLGKIIIRLASLVPYLMRVVFKGAYLLVEVPICWIHGAVGSYFHGIDNGLANGGDKIDTFLGRWYTCWRNPKSSHISMSIAIYIMLLIWICNPYHSNEANIKFTSGQALYLMLENKLIDWLETHNLYEVQVKKTMNYDEPELAVPELTEEENITLGIVMKVITKKDPLAVRDVPSVENCVILESVEKENTVFWTGDLAFGIGNNGDMEPWIRVETSNGTIGWARLIYLCPVNEEDLEINLKMDLQEAGYETKDDSSH